MAEKTLNARIQEKHDSEANWLLATNFTPKEGEVIVYSNDNTYEMPRVKVGDGSTLVNDLPFFYEPLTGQELHNILINRVPFSIDTDGTVYNETGYKNGYRIRSGGAEGESWQAACTGFIPVNGGDIIRISGVEFSAASNNNAINSADNTFTNIGQFTMLPAHYGIYSGDYATYGADSVVEESEGIWKWVVPPTASGVAYIRISGHTTTGGNGETLIISINSKMNYTKIFSFSIDSVVYSAEDGMTWNEWINSSYNIDGFVDYGDGIFSKNSQAVIGPNKVQEAGTNIIITEYNYTLDSAEPT